MNRSWCKRSGAISLGRLRGWPWLIGTGCAAVLTASSLADEPEGEIWYDADGEVAWVDGPAAEPLPPPFVPEWKRREWERRDNQAAAGRRPGRYDSDSSRSRYHYFSYPHIYRPHYSHGHRFHGYRGYRHFGSHSGFRVHIGF